MGIPTGPVWLTRGLVPLAGGCALLLLTAERGRLRRAAGVGAVLALVAALLVGVPAPLAAGLVLVLLVLDSRDVLQGECAMKLLWVLGAALALSLAGGYLLVAATGTERVGEQWGVLALGLEAPFLWSAALSLSLCFGLVLVGAPPFHFWVADLLQGARPWLGPLALAALQWAGVRWLSDRLDGIAQFPAGAAVAQGVMRVVAVVGLLAGAFTLLVQHRPERRAGTLASLQGSLVVCAFAAGAPPEPAWTAGWGVHLVVAITGAAALARFLPAAPSLATPPGALARSHPATTVVGLLSWFSLAGLPGTPGGQIWLEVGRQLLAAGLGGLFVVLVAAWVVALGACFGQLREAFGLAAAAAPPGSRVPLAARLVPWMAAGGIAGCALARLGN
jgi:NADH:ubiquinone oxidoreductase subunit 2 (subunit N)